MKAGYPISGKEKLIGWLVGWSPPIAGTCLVLKAVLSDGMVSADFLFVGALLAFYVSGIFVHEFTHFIVAKFLRLNPWCIRIGHGKTLFDKQLGTFHLVLKQFPYSGAVYASVPIERARRRSFAMIAAGPFSNLAITVGAALLLLNQLQWTPVLPPEWGLLLWSALWSNLAITLQSLTSNPAQPERCDGAQMRQLLRNSQPHSETPSNWKSIIQNLESDILLPKLRLRLTRSGLSEDERYRALDEFATAVLMYGANEYLPEAVRYSEELIRLKPDEWTVKGTRGSVLVENGELVEGMSMLLRVMHYAPGVMDRSISASFLALAEIKRNNFIEAAKWLDCSRELDPNCASLLRIQKLLHENDPDLQTI